MTLPRTPIPEHPRVSVVIPVRNEERFIEQFMANLQAQDYPLDLMEIILVDGRSNDRTLQLIEACRGSFPHLIVQDNPRRERPTALNIGLELATGDLILIMDVHVRYPPEYVSGLVKGLQGTDADYVGGRIETAAGAPGLIAETIALVLSHPFGAGGRTFRTSTASGEGFAPFGCYRRELPLAVGGYNERLPRSDDNQFMARIARAGGKNWICGNICSTYYARSTLRRLCEQMFGNGASHVATFVELPGQFQKHHLIPFAFVSSLLLGILLAALVPWGWILLAVVLGPYLVIDFVSAAQLARRAGLRFFLPSLLLFPVLHIVYGLGTWWGLPAFGLFKAHRRGGRRSGLDMITQTNKS